MVARPSGQPLEQLVPPDPWVVTDHQLGAIDNMDPGSLATGIMEREAKEQQEPQHQGDKPAGAGEVSTAVAQLLFQAMAPEMLAVLVGGEGEQHHDEEGVPPRGNLPPCWR